MTKEVLPRSETIEKHIPAIGQLLYYLDDFFYDTFGKGTVSNLIIARSAAYHLPYARWEFVRTVRAKELVGNVSLPTTGAEGWLAGLPPEKIILAEAKTSAQALDDITHTFRNQPQRMSRMEKVLNGENFTDSRALSDADTLFQTARTRMRYLFHQETEPYQQAANQRFRQETDEFLMGLSPIMEKFEKGKFVLIKTFPQHTALVIPAAGENIDLPQSLEEKYLVLARLGIIGIPTLRTIIESPALTLAARRYDGGYNFAFKGSTVRERIKNDLSLRFLAELDKKNPGMVK